MSKLISQKLNSMDIQDLVDTDTPIGEILSGKFKRSFAYYTIKERLPVILTRIIDTLSRDKEEISQKYGSAAMEDVKHITGFISKLRNEVMTNKPLQPISKVPNRLDDDVDKWNNAIEKRVSQTGETPTWFNTEWLLCECYMYRSIMQEISMTKLLKAYDPFEKLKQESFKTSVDSMTIIGKHLIDLINKAKNLPCADIETEFNKLLKFSLWGNRCDLSLSAGANSSENGDPIQMLQSLENDLLIDDTECIWKCLNNNTNNSDAPVDIVLDNAGYELFTDLCLSVFLSKYFSKRIRFYVKRFPWYVSDVTKADFYWMINSLKNASDEYLQNLGEICHDFLTNGMWSIQIESFWTEPYVFAEMKIKNASLYDKLSEAIIVIFKGDLNYRKLLGDLNWEHSTKFLVATDHFHPTTVASLRTLKSDIVVGLPFDKEEYAKKLDPNWMIDGRFGIIQTIMECGCSKKETKI